MTQFEWTSSLETGHQEIDEQHRGIFDLANTLTAALAADDADEDAIADAVWGLSDYVVEHFRDEEALMAEAGFPGLRAHKLLHTRLSAQTLSLVADFFNGESVAATRIAPFVTSWLQEHILAEDTALASHIKASVG